MTTIDEVRASGRWPFCWGPVGDPNSKDPFEWAHARMAPGWHVEGLVTADGVWTATNVNKGVRPVRSYSKEGLVEAVHLAKRDAAA